MERRVAIKWMLSAVAALPLLERAALAADTLPGARAAQGYGPDPDVMKNYRPGDVWPLTFTPEQRLTAIALCDAIIPDDAHSPSASSVGVHDFIDEWISSPYPAQKPDRKIILDGLAWLDQESQRRYANRFTNLVLRQRNAICAELAQPDKARLDPRPPATFFRRFRDLTAGGYYTTPVGMRDLGYVGNVALTSFEGPPPELLRAMNLA